MRPSQAMGLLCIIYLAGCQVKGSTEKDLKNLTLPVIRINCIDTLLHRSYVANINAFRNIELRAKVSGFLENIFVDEGQFVKKGQLLFKLNDAEFKVQLSEAKAALSSAQADVKSAEVELERVKTLVDKEIVTNSELELAKVRLAAAKSRVDEAMAKEEKAEIHLSYTSIHAPFNGIIDRIPHRQGSLISEGTLLSTVSDIHAMHVYFNVSEHEYLNYIKNGKESRFGQPATLILADGSTYKHEGRIETMEGSFEKGTGSIAFRAIFPNPEKLLKHGGSGKIILASAIHKALLIPQKAVFEIQDKNYVYLLDSNNTVRMTSFVPDTRIDDFVLVKSGLSDGDRIIYEGVQNIRDGVKIVPRMLRADSLFRAE